MLWLQADFDASERHACEVLHVHRSSVRYQSQAKDQAPLTARIKEIAAVRVRYGYKRIHVLLRREGWGVNHKRVYRLYCQEGLNLRRKRPRRHVSAANRQMRPEVTRANECWAMDFVPDALFDGRRLRVLTVLDVFTRESLALEVGQSLRGDEVAGVLEMLLLNRPAPKRICCDNGPEFVSKTDDKWAYEHGIELVFSRPGKPMDNGYIESFNGRFREECLNANWFLSLADAKRKISAWQGDYNVSRPHMSLGYMTPVEFSSQARQLPGLAGQTECRLLT